MLRAASEFLGQTIHGRDRRLGTVEDLYFDACSGGDWRVRHARVKTGLPFRRGHLLIDASVITRPAWPAPHLDTWLTRPDISRDGHPNGSAGDHTTGSTNRQANGYENGHVNGSKNGHARASTNGHANGTTANDGLPSPLHAMAPRRQPGGATSDDALLLEDAYRSVTLTNLRSVREASAYRLSAREGDAGRVRDFIIDDRTWTITHLEADVELLLGKKRILIPSYAIEEVDPPSQMVRVALTRRVLGGAPRLQRLALQSRLYQMCIYDYYATATGVPARRRPAPPTTSRSVDARLLLTTMRD